jgi:hypothetical protein
MIQEREGGRNLDGTEKEMVWRDRNTTPPPPPKKMKKIKIKIKK